MAVVDIREAGTPTVQSAVGAENASRHAVRGATIVAPVANSRSAQIEFDGHGCDPVREPLFHVFAGLPEFVFELVRSFLRESQVASEPAGDSPVDVEFSLPEFVRSSGPFVLLTS